MRLCLFATLVCLVSLAHAADPPDPQLTLPCRVVEVYDGDTLTVEVRLRASVRLLDCWAPEIRTTDKREKELGQASAAALKVLAEGRDGRITIPLTDVDRLDEIFTFGRVLGHVHLDGERRNLSEQMRKAGHAWSTKEQLERVLRPPDP